MNQILVSEKVYVTPELKRKKTAYKVYFFIAVFLVFILSSYYIYAEYDKNKSEEQSQEILSGLSFESAVADDTTIKFEDDATIVILNQEDPESVVISSTLDEDAEVPVENSDGEVQTANVKKYKTQNGEIYWAIATINIPSIDCTYPILNTWSTDLLKIAPCYYHGAQPNQPGNFCVAGHNYRNDKFFSHVPELREGDIIEITDLTDQTVQYSVYANYVVSEDDNSCTSQMTDGNTELTLITCTNNGKKRVIVKARKLGE